MKSLLVALLVAAGPALAEDSSTRLEDILSGKADEKEQKAKESTSDDGGNKSHASSGGSSSVSAAPVGQKFSLLTGKTVGNGTNVLAGGYEGLLGVHAQFLHGITDSADLGARFAFVLYPFEGEFPFNGTDRVVAGVRLQGLLRLKFVESGRLSFGMKFEPGFFAYFTLSSVQLGFLLPVGVQIGLTVSSALNIALGLDVPLYITFGTGPDPYGYGGPFRRNVYVVVPIVAGGGLEYFIRSDLMLYAQLHLGPAINFGNYGGAALHVDLKAGIAWKF